MLAHILADLSAVSDRVTAATMLMAICRRLLPPVGRQGSHRRGACAEASGKGAKRALDVRDPNAKQRMRKMFANVAAKPRHVVKTAATDETSDALLGDILGSIGAGDSARPAAAHLSRAWTLLSSQPIKRSSLRDVLDPPACRNADWPPQHHCWRLPSAQRR